MATHFSILAWNIPWTEELEWRGGGSGRDLQSMRSQRVRYELAHTHNFCTTKCLYPTL